MKANVYRLLPNRARIKRQEAAEVSAMVAATNLPRHLKERVRHELYRAVEPDSERSPFGKYVMLSVQQIGAIWDALRALPAKDRPQEVRHAFDLCVLNLRQDTGEVMLTRDEIAERMGIAPRKVSEAMGVMERMGIIIKGERRRVEGLRGRGVASYFVNPHAAWNGLLELQKIEARRQTPPLLALMQGGKND
jgi:CRP-like cAMP-binding protein